MNETNLQIAIKDYIKKLKSKNDLINDLNKKLEELKNKKDILANTKKSLKEQNNKINKKKADRIILSTLSNKKFRCSSCGYKQLNKSLSTSITQSNKNISVNQKTEFNESKYITEKTKKNVQIAIFKNLKKKMMNWKKLIKNSLLKKRLQLKMLLKLKKNVT